MLIGLATGQELPNGHRGASWLEYLQDCANGHTRLGESARRSTEHGSPLLMNERASGLLSDVHSMLLRWVAAVNTNAEILAAPE
jgi:hypothetical protein